MEVKVVADNKGWSLKLVSDKEENTTKGKQVKYNYKIETEEKRVFQDRYNISIKVRYRGDKGKEDNREKHNQGQSQGKTREVAKWRE